LRNFINLSVINIGNSTIYHIHINKRSIAKKKKNIYIYIYKYMKKKVKCKNTIEMKKIINDNKSIDIKISN